MFQPMVVIALREIIARVGTTALQTGGGGDDGGKRHLHHVFQLQCFDAGGVKHVTMVAQYGVLQALLNSLNLSHAGVKYVLSTKHAAMSTHGFTQFLTYG